jgi:hypothetical protein
MARKPETVSLGGNNSIHEQDITRRAIRVSGAVIGWIYTMSLTKDLLCHPSLVEGGTHLISDETTDAANRKDLIASGNSRALVKHRCLPTSQTKRSSDGVSVFGSIGGPDRKSLLHNWINCFRSNGLAKYALAPRRMTSSDIFLS